MGKPKHSAVWNYFQPIDEYKAICSVCNKVIRHKSSTSNLRRHLERRHPTVNVEVKPVNAPSNLQSTSNVKVEMEESVIGFSEDNSPLLIIPKKVKPAKVITNTITNNNVTASPLPQNFETIDRCLLQLFTNDYQSPSIVDDEGFQKFVQALNPSYSLPDERSVKQLLLPALHEDVSIETNKIVKQAALVTLTIDHWTSVNKENFLAVTVHFITENFEIKTVLLECTFYNSSDIAARLKQIVTSWHLENKIMLAISDNTADIKKAIKKELKWNFFPCYAGTINHIAQEALNTVQPLVNKVQNLVVHFNCDSAACTWLSDIQKDSGNEPKKLIKNNGRIWTSTFYMIERLLALEEAVKTITALLDNDSLSIISAEEWLELKDIKQVLQPMESITKIMYGKIYVSLSSIIILTKGLERVYIEKQKNKMLPSALNMGMILLNGIRTHLGDLEENTTLLTCTFVDPRFKNVGFSDETTAELARSTVEKLVCDKRSKLDVEMTSVNSNADEKIDVSSVWGHFDKKVATNRPSSTHSSQAAAEIERYLDADLLQRHEDPLVWWKQNAAIYPVLSQVAIERMGTTATALPCERLYSKNGQKMCDRRSQLSLEEVKDLVFLNGNRL